MKNLLFAFSFLFVLVSCQKKEQVNTDYINNVFERAFNEKKFNGSVLVYRDNRVVYDKSFGKADYENNIDFTDETIFQLASVSKQFTAAGILILEQEGLLSTDDLVSKYLSDYPFDNVRVIHLLNHTSGMPNFQETMMGNLDSLQINGNDEMLGLLKTKKYPLQWQPGDKWEYCDIAFCTAATLMEKVSGRNFKEFMAEKIFMPANMTHTSAEYFTDTRLVDLSNLSQGYELDTINNQFTVAYNLPHNNYVRMLGGFYGDGSVYSTPKDMIKWFQALQTNEVLTEKSKEKLFCPTKLNNNSLVVDYGFNYGLGWYIGKNESLGTFYFHPGGQAGYCSKFLICPEKDLAVIMLSNLSHIDFFEFTNIYDDVLLRK